MSMLDLHSSALTSINEAHHNFLLRYQKAAKQVYGFIEGKEDPMFYRSIIEASIPSDWTVALFPCGGKEKVFEVRSALDWSRFASQRVCFFVDRDLSDYINDAGFVLADNVYVTDGYSIENDVISSGLLHRLISEVFNIQNLEVDETDTLSSLFDREVERFRLALVPLMAQILLWRKAQANAPLNKLDLKDFFNISDGVLSITFENKYAMVQAASLNVGAPCASNSDLDAAEAEFTGANDYTRFIRGKFLLWFLAKFVISIHEGTPKFCRKAKCPPKMNVTVGANNMVVFAAPRARASNSLRSFVKNNYMAYIAAA
ncbi:DUF4435 domain-containing protein [Ensifer sp. P24N7]|uniref:DUF4435 domain-containing protein n=1 Tax=Sinorhizobium sp. P24N7 TaxID=3348358 RepID=UPI0035F3D776